ncbi:MAG: thioredoxin family protein [Methanomicrobiales archaeon]
MAVRVMCFSQKGCMGCEEQRPINREVSEALEIEIDEIDVTEEPDYIRTYNLRVTPTILVISNGIVQERFEGVVHQEDLEDAINRAAGA